MTLVLLNLFLALSAIGLALRLGGPIERKGALLLLLMLVIGVLGSAMHGNVFHTLNPVSLALDLLAFVGFSLLGIYSKRVWPLWAAAFQLLSVGAHLVRAFEIEVRPIVYAWMKSGPTWAVVVLLIIGTVGHHQRTRRAASDPFLPG